LAGAGRADPERRLSHRGGAGPLQAIGRAARRRGRRGKPHARAGRVGPDQPGQLGKMPGTAGNRGNGGPNPLKYSYLIVGGRFPLSLKMVGTGGNRSCAAPAHFAGTARPAPRARLWLPSLPGPAGRGASFAGESGRM
jgi:hypothetical protein